MKLDQSERRTLKERVEQSRETRKFRADYFRQQQIDRAIKRLLQRNESTQPRA